MVEEGGLTLSSNQPLSWGSSPAFKDSCYGNRIQLQGPTCRQYQGQALTASEHACQWRGRKQTAKGRVLPQEMPGGT